jgi:tetratricopeptide (TPR) repeat protein
VIANRISFPELAVYTRPDHPLAGRYLIEREIGVGGMALVFAARDLKHDRVVAVKVLRGEFGTSVSADRFTREIQIAAGLTHPNILPVHDSGSVDGLLYYVMPYVEGGTLVERMTRDGRLPLSDVRRITREVGAALQFAHARGIVHRDVKPANVLLPGGVAVVADFGLARAIESAASDPGEPVNAEEAAKLRITADQRLTQIGFGLGTPTYMSPEQGSGEREIDARSDQYSLACMVYEMLVGRPPFSGPSYQRLLAQHITEVPPRIRTLRPEVPDSVESAIARALSKSPEQRFDNIDEFLRALDGDGGRLTGTWGVRPMSSRLFSRRNVIGAMMVAAAIIAGIFAIRRLNTFAVSRATLDPNLIAVAPFTVFGTANAEWREGLVDVLARDFDGAGPLRTVSPSMVLRRIQGPVDRAAAMGLAKSTGAGVVVYGQLLETGTARDSVRARVTVHDVAKDSAIGEFEVLNAVTRMDAVADSIALRALRQLGNVRSIAAVPRAYFGSRSLPALKSFLRGEQHYRKNDFEAARADYEQAIALDSGFALAYRRMRGVLRGISGEFDSLSLVFAARAGAANRRSSPRDSLLILADSLAAVHRLAPAFADGQWIGSIRRRLATLQDAARLYADDPEVWSELGEARVHYGERVGVDDRAALDAFDRALKIDSTYGPAFYHAIDLTLQLRGAAAALPLVNRYIRLNPSDEAFSLVQGVLRGVAARKLLEQVDALGKKNGTLSALQLLLRFPDPGDVGSELYVHWLGNETGVTPLRRMPVSRRYAFRGRLMEAAKSADDAVFHANSDGMGLFLALARAGSVPSSRASAVFDQVARDADVALLPFANAWWMSQSDTASLAASGAIARKARAKASPEQAGLAAFAEQSAGAYARLVRADTTGALGLFLQLADSSVSRSLMPLRLDVARILLARDRARQAADYLDARPPFPGTATIWDVEWRLERARAADQLGDRATARLHYAAAVAAWEHADAALQPKADEARIAARKLGLDPSR